ncbi:MAG: T9SS type A sorting domain-containing protein [Bacteroidetes bacterium]|nr:T9SS type A sorting domain-containing protein [Bacteroidota bacterium]
MKKKIFIWLFLFFFSEIIAQDATISIPNLTAAVNTNILIPINITPLENVGSITLKIKYDSKIISFEDEIINNAIIGGFFNINSDADNTIIVSWYSISPIKLNGKLFDLKFNYLGGNGAIKFDFVEIANNLSVSYSVAKIDGSIASESNNTPIFVNVLPDTTISELETLVYQYTANDQDGDLLSFSMVTGPVGATITNSGLFTWTSENRVDISQTIIVSLTDQSETVFDTAEVSLLTNIEDRANNIPTKLSLFQNYPNPFNPSTEIRYSLSEASKVTIKIYNSIGQEIATLVNKFQDSGQYSVIFNAGNQPSGIFLYSINADEYVLVKKMLLLK